MVMKVGDDRCIVFLHKPCGGGILQDVRTITNAFCPNCMCTMRFERGRDAEFQRLTANTMGGVLSLIPENVASLRLKAARERRMQGAVLVMLLSHRIRQVTNSRAMKGGRE